MKLEIDVRKASDCTTDPKMSQQANEKLTKQQHFTISEIHLGGFCY